MDHYLHINEKQQLNTDIFRNKLCKINNYSHYLLKKNFKPLNGLEKIQLIEKFFMAKVKNFVANFFPHWGMSISYNHTIML